MKRCSIGNLATPIGAIHFATDEADRLCGLCFKGGEVLRGDILKFHGTPDEWHEFAPPAIVEKILRYFAGEVDLLDAIETRPCGSEFERRVWEGLRAIPAGSTKTYGEIARQIDHPGAARAVGAANGRNPIALVVPCHRVVGANGELVGYGAGIDRKRWLLAHEAVATAML